MIKTNASYSFEFRGRDGQTDGFDLGMHFQRPFERYITCPPKLKISWRRGKQYDISNRY